VHEDWGVRTDRWAGIRSGWVEVLGTQVHVLRADAAPDAPADATPQLLLHGLGGAATNWIEVLAGLSHYGPVIAPDLPGFGRTEPPRPRATRVSITARFLRAFAAVEGLDRMIVHGNSMGGMLAVLLADLEPERVERLVLVDPAMPSPPGSYRSMSPATLLKFVPFVIPPLGRAVLGRAWRRMDAEALWADNVALVHGDGDRLSPEIAAVGVENLDWGRQRPWRLDGFTAAATSVVSTITLGSRDLNRAVDRISAPTLLLWGDRDRLVGRPVIDNLTDRRPDWPLHVFETVGHAPQVEVPREYLEVVGRWLTDGTVGASDLAG
jgi:pimeloyl-ACP methyl ester carboxylesterase